MKLHLGCGQNYLKGYLNIDFPSSEHTVQQKSVADKLADITKLKYRSESIEEIRLHHVFEHFPRTQALGLVVSWNSWLVKNGILRIAVPNFNAMAMQVLNPLTPGKQKSLALRHIFGSQEAGWANHYEGYSRQKLVNLLGTFNFKVETINNIHWKKMHNIEVIAKRQRLISVKKASERAKKYLSHYLVDDSPSEKKMLKTWLNDFKNQIDLSYAPSR